MVGDREMVYSPVRAPERARSTIPSVETEFVTGAGHLLNIELPEFVEQRLERFLSATPGDVDADLSFTAFAEASVARAAATDPRLHAYRDWRGRLVSHRQVDGSTMVEIPTQHGSWPMVESLSGRSSTSPSPSTAGSSTEPGRPLRQPAVPPDRGGSGA